MALRTILSGEDETLKKTSREVKNFDARLHMLLDDLRETMHENNGVGLAAPQVGVLRRAVVIEPSDGELYELINPVIVSTEGTQNGSEGCLSFPGVYGMVERPQTVTVKAFDRNGVEFTATGEGLLARAFCHEIDHLNGVLYTSLVTELIKVESEIEPEDDE